MGRSILAEENIETQISLLYTKDKWKIGLIIGQVTEQKDYVVHLAPTPKSDTVQDAETAPKKTKKQDTLDTVDESWICIHARQVLRMLPGGLDIVGIFGLAPPEMMSAAQAKLRQLLFAVHKVASGSRCQSSAPSTDRILLQLCPITHKVTCRTFDVADNKSAARPADWKYQRFTDRWQRLDTTLSVERLIPVPNAAMSQSLEKQLLRGIQPVIDNIWNSLGTVNQELLDDDRLLNPNQPSGKKSKKQQEENSGLVYSVDFLHRKNPVKREEVTDPTTLQCGAKLHLRGAMCCRAFVHSKATVAEALKALRCDVVRSLTSRCELLCEDLLQAEEEQDTRVLYETPVRVFCPLSESSAQLCDYMFRDETNNDVVDRLKELLDLTVPEDTLETDCEAIPDDQDFLRPDGKLKPDGGDISSVSQSSSNMTLMLLCLVAALLAAVIAIMLQT